MGMRIGHGYDVHRVTAGRPLILGGGGDSLGMGTFRTLRC